jgi:hypothetical protein
MYKTQLRIFSRPKLPAWRGPIPKRVISLLAADCPNELLYDDKTSAQLIDVIMDSAHANTLDVRILGA